MKHIIICDIDGTIADLSHRLHYIQGPKKDWKAFHANVKGDAVHNDIKKILWALLVDGAQRKVIYISGRMEICREDTVTWLNKHGFPHGQLSMRANGDYRPDYVVKEEKLDWTQLTPSDVLCVLDDRDQVVQMWRRRGFRVLQVANGDF